MTSYKLPVEYSKLEWYERRLVRGDCALVLKGYGVVTVLTDEMCKNNKVQTEQQKHAESY